MWWKTLAQEHVKPMHRVNSDACAILSYLSPTTAIPSGVVERELRKLNGIKEVMINPLTHTVTIRYDLNVMTVEKMRSFLKRLSRIEA